MAFHVILLALTLCCVEVLTYGVQDPSKCAASVSAFPPDPASGCCGIDNYAGDKIRGGIDASIDQYPWLVLIEYVQGDQVFISCGGTLISGKYVLTAAHCVHGRLIHGPPRNIRLGEYDTSHDGPDAVEVEPGYFDKTDGAMVIPIESYIIHPAYSASFNFYTASRHDLALIRMTRNAPFTDFIRPICLPTADVAASPPSNLTLHAAGWGAVNNEKKFSDIKQFVALPYVDIKTCQAAFNLPRLYAELWAGQICAGGEAGKDSCKGDSGGPLMYLNSRVAEIVGVVSFGHEECGTQNVPAVYTKVFKYMNWIIKNIVA